MRSLYAIGTKLPTRMANSARNRLLRGVKGVDLGKAVLLFANDKCVLTSKGTLEHFTLHLGPNSKVLDVHRTTIGADGSSTHVTLFSITHANLAAMMQELALPIAAALIGLAHPLSPERMAKRRVGAIVGLLPTGADMCALTRVDRRRLAVDRKKLISRTWAPEFLDELYDLEEGKIFALFWCPRGRRPRKIGYGFPVTDCRRHRRLIWIPDQRVAEAFQLVGNLLEDMAARYGSYRTLG